MLKYHLKNNKTKRKGEKMKKKYNNILYYIAFSIAVILRLCTSSVLFNVTHDLNKIITFIIILLFAIKIMLDKHTFKELIAIIIGSILFIYLYLILDLAFLLIAYFAFIAIKNVNINTVVRIDIFIKIFFIGSHAFLYGIDYLFDYSKIESLIIISKKGISHCLYFVNPNTIGMLSFWLVMDLVFINKDLDYKKHIFFLMILIIIYYISKCRTSLYSYIIFILLSIIKKEKIVQFIYKYIYVILAIISFLIINDVKENSSYFSIMNGLLSGRLSYSIRAYNIVGLHFLPNYLSEEFFSNYTIDNFYVRCYIFYGVLSMIIMYIPIILIPKKNFTKEKTILIMSCIFLFFEAVTINIGYAIPYLIAADIIFNKKREIIKE